MNKIFWTFFLLLTFVITLPASWWLLAKADFFYAPLHDTISIDSHIEKYAPKNNKNKMGFERTTKTERVALFHSIVDAIHNKGIGLQNLSYLNSKNQKVTLLTDAEVIHLKDVANLLENLNPAVLAAVILWVLLLFYLFIRRVQIPSTKQLLLYSSFLVLLSALVLLLGPEKVFNQLHVWIFPDNHQWFFYYEDSLMSILMKAPDLFAYIAGVWVIVSAVFTVFLFKAIRYMRPSII